MTSRNVLILAALFSLLAAYAFFSDRLPRREDVSGLSRDVLPQIQGKDVKGLVLTLSDKPLVLEKKDKQWYLTGPSQMAADTDTVEAMIAVLEFLAPERVLAPDAAGQTLDMAQYGLAAPSRKITIATAGKEDIMLLLGNKTATGKSLYANVQGRKEVLVLPMALLDKLQKNPEQLRNRVMLEFDLDQISALTLQNENGLFELQLRGNDGAAQWIWKRPIADKQVNQQALNTILWELRRLKFKAYLGAERQPAMLWSKPAAKVSVFLKDRPEPQVLLIGNALPDGSWTAKMQGTPDVFTLEAEQVKPLQQDLAQEAPSPPAQ